MAVRRPTMRFVTVKTVEQQGRLMQHRVRFVSACALYEAEAVSTALVADSRIEHWLVLVGIGLNQANDDGAGQLLGHAAIADIVHVQAYRR
jgi:hypothetical protein